MKNHRSLLAAAVALPAAGLILAGCGSSTASESTEADSAAISVVATTNVYGQIARAIGGESVEVSEIITSAAQDPHSYEPTARDKLAISNASLVLANGGGYDQFMDSLVSSIPEGKAGEITLVHAVDSSPVAEDSEAAGHEGESAEEHAQHAEEDPHEGHDHAAYNEHIWYDLESMGELADALAESFAEADSANAEQYQRNAVSFNEGIDKLEQQLETAKLDGKSFVMTEPVPFHLLHAAGMEDATPEGLSEAIEEGEGIAPMTMKKAEDLLSAGNADVLAYNVQTEGSETKALRKSAEQGQIPVVDFAETIQDDSSYLDWMESNISDLASAING
ncbi:metal ABC transporter solute-binding protein, Zn/Mn family [Glutamicibacter nicotianae]|uniref:metal ABC transporter solute-binding protein, Zn/Mn family n=1 Tax=Glutamicibacter nicotianae TaxID=37929 RepID=UPI0019586652|nr:zinc ABC transporter substrate-binding protein [Glutamicibacter nicotianae]MBM7769357.1 zinc/manganese transport system substrate-binding protein [Glutamicibacter nicotianae]